MEIGKFYITLEHVITQGLVIRCDSEVDSEGKAFSGTVVFPDRNSLYRKGEKTDNWSVEAFREMTPEELKDRSLQLDLFELGL